MQKTLKKQVPGLAGHQGDVLRPDRRARPSPGPCTAKFTVAKYELKGTFKAKAKLSATSRLSWSTSSRTCTDLHGRRASCTGETNTGKA